MSEFVNEFPVGNEVICAIVEGKLITVRDGKMIISDNAAEQVEMVARGAVLENEPILDGDCDESWWVAISMLVFLFGCALGFILMMLLAWLLF